MSIRSYQLLLPELEVEHVTSLRQLQAAADDMLANAAAYVLPEFDLHNTLRWHRGVKLVARTEGIYATYPNHYTRDAQVTAGEFYWVRSSNGRRTITEDPAAYAGHFACLPEALLVPDSGAHLLGDAPDGD